MPAQAAEVSRSRIRNWRFLRELYFAADTVNACRRATNGRVTPKGTTPMIAATAAQRRKRS